MTPLPNRPAVDRPTSMRLLAVAIGAILAASDAAVAVAIAAPAPTPRARIEKAVEALGGRRALESIRAVRFEGVQKQWNLGESLVAAAEPMFMSEASFVATRDLGNDSIRVDWKRKIAYPWAMERSYSDVLSGGIGCVTGADGYDPKAPARAISAWRLAALHRDHLRTSPRFLLDVLSRGRLEAAPAEKVGKRRLAAVRWSEGPVSLLLLFDGGSPLPERIRAWDDDHLEGDVAYDLVPGDWRAVGDARIAHSWRFELSGRVDSTWTISSISVNPEIALGTFSIPAEIAAKAPKRATEGPIPWQSVLQLYAVMVFPDIDGVQPLEMKEIAPGIELIGGGTHNGMVVAMKDQVVVFDAPVDPYQSRWTIEAVEAKYPGKPIRTLVLSHHHFDHVAGLREYAALGADLVVAASLETYFDGVIKAKHGVLPDALAKNPRPVKILPVAGARTLTDGIRRIELYVVDPSNHSDGNLIAWIPDAKVGYVCDLWNPGYPFLSKFAADYVAAVRKNGIPSETVWVGGHGGFAPFTELEKLLEKK